MFLVDSHCHFDLLDPEAGNHQVDDVIARANAADVKYFLNVCVSMAEFPSLLKTVEQYDCMSTSVGLHPNYDEETVDIDTLVKLGQHPKVVAIGETGLDYFRSTGDLDWQRERFRQHIQAAKILGKPLIIHTRNAKDDTLRIMKEEGASDVGGVMHCFSEDLETANRAMDMNFAISFSGVVTFKNAAILQEVAKLMPIQQMLIETDSPYLAPIPHRGKPNEPAYVRYTAEFIANLRGISLETLADATTHNFFNLFKGAVRPHV